MRSIKFLIIVLFIVISSISQSFGITDVIPEDSFFSIEFNLQNYPQVIEKVAKQFSASDKDLREWWNDVRKETTDNLGIDLTNPQELLRNGIDINRPSGFSIVKFDKYEPAFVILLSINNESKVREFINGIVKHGYIDKKKEIKTEKISYKGKNIISVAKKSSWSNKFREDLAVTMFDSYCLLSNKSDNLKIVIDAYNSGKTIGRMSELSLARRYTSQNAVCKMYFTGSFFKNIMTMMGSFYPRDLKNAMNVITNEWEMYKLMVVGISIGRKDIELDGYSFFNTEHAKYRDFMKMYRSDKEKIDMLSYLPKGGYGYLDITYNVNVAFNKMGDFFNYIMKNAKSEINDLKKYLRIDIVEDVIKKIEAYHGMAIFDLDREFVDDGDVGNPDNMDFLVYGQMSSTGAVANVFQKIYSFMSESKEVPIKPDAITINGNRFYALRIPRVINLYFGNYNNYAILTSKKSTLEGLINNITNKNRVFQTQNPDAYKHRIVTADGYFELGRFLSSMDIRYENIFRNIDRLYLYSTINGNVSKVSFRITFKK